MLFQNLVSFVFVYSDNKTPGFIWVAWDLSIFLYFIFLIIIFIVFLIIVLLLVLVVVILIVFLLNMIGLIRCILVSCFEYRPTRLIILLLCWLLEILVRYSEILHFQLLNSALKCLVLMPELNQFIIHCIYRGRCLISCRVQAKFTILSIALEHVVFNFIWDKDIIVFSVILEDTLN